MNQFITLVGTIVRTGAIKPLVTRMSFTCVKCNGTQIMTFAAGKYTHPTKCEAYGCRGRILTPCRNAQSKTVDWQRIRVQEDLTDDALDAGRIPRTVECELMNQMVDTVVPGDVVKISGIVKVLATTDTEKSKNKTSQMYYLYVDVNVIQANGGGDEKQDSKSTGFTEDDLYNISEIHYFQGDTFKMLVHSLCPSIFGHHLVKAGLLLTLFGKREVMVGGRRRDDQEETSIRSDPHILIVGNL